VSCVQFWFSITANTQPYPYPHTYISGFEENINRRHIASNNIFAVDHVAHDDASAFLGVVFFFGVGFFVVADFLGGVLAGAFCLVTRPDLVLWRTILSSTVADAW